MRLSTPFSLLALLPLSASFAPSFLARTHVDSQSKSSLSLAQQNDNFVDNVADALDATILSNQKIVISKLSFRQPLPEERGKGGVHAKESIAALEVMARIPRNMIIATCDSPPRAIAASAEAKELSWAADLCAATLVSLFPDENDHDDSSHAKANKMWVANWKAGGWATDGADLGPPDVDWGIKCCTGSLMSTGSDIDELVYAKFRFPCHPTVHRAGLGLALLTGAPEDESLDALLLRGKAFRGMRDALSPLVLDPSEERKGSINERKSWDVADVLSRVLSRATTMNLVTDDNDDEVETYAVVPVHERLGHCNDAQGENSKLVASISGDEVLLVATRDIDAGEEITRDYVAAPRLDGDATEGALRLLLQFGLPPNSWETN